MKRVFSSSNEVAHIFAQQSQDKGSAGNIFFEGKDIFSYGRHFIIARFHDSKTVFFTTKSYSNSTTKHQSIVSRALNHFDFIYIHHIGDSFEELNKHYAYTINDAIERAAKAKTKTADYLASARHDYEEFKKYCSIVYPKQYKTELKALEKIVSNIDLSEVKKTLERLKQEKIAKDKQYEKEQAEKIEKWKNGESDFIPNINTIYLRIKNDDVQTSYGATVSLREAKLLFALINAKKDIAGFKIGNYTVISYLDNILKIGCHKITTEEINRIAPFLQ